MRLLYTYWTQEFLIVDRYLRYKTTGTVKPQIPYSTDEYVETFLVARKGYNYFPNCDSKEKNESSKLKILGEHFLEKRCNNEKKLRMVALYKYLIEQFTLLEEASKR